MIIADENIEQFIIDALRKQNYEIYSIREQSAGIDDKAVIEIARSKNAILLTEDKDFGELFFAHKFDKQSIILLRPVKTDQSEILHHLLITMEKIYKNPKRCFIVITKSKIRVKEI